MSRIGDKLTIVVVAVPESGARDQDEMCAECIFNTQENCDDMGCVATSTNGCDDVIFVPEGDADRYIVRAMERRME